MSKKKKIIIAVISAVLLLGLVVAANIILYEKSIKYTQVKIPYLYEEDTSTKRMKNAEPGDIIVFGSYEQDNKTSNGEESIEWIVLSNNGSELFVVSKYALDCQEYEKQRVREITWEKCSLREWLNDDFYNEAFSSSEKSMIKTTYVVNNDSPEYGTEGGNDTQDKIFLLSVEEVTNPQFRLVNAGKKEDASRRCAPTAYAVAQGTFISRENDCTSEGFSPGEWWLRSPGHRADCAASVGISGSVYIGVDVNHVDRCVRPALVIDLNP